MDDSYFRLADDRKVKMQQMVVILVDRAVQRVFDGNDRGIRFALL